MFAGHEMLYVYIVTPPARPSETTTCPKDRSWKINRRSIPDSRTEGGTGKSGSCSKAHDPVKSCWLNISKRGRESDASTRRFYDPKGSISIYLLERGRMLCTAFREKALNSFRPVMRSTGARLPLTGIVRGRRVTY